MVSSFNRFLGNRFAHQLAGDPLSWLHGSVPIAA
jgi:hypothetical protein